MSIAALILSLVSLLYWVVVILIFARIILSFVNLGSYELRDLVFRLTEPMLAPIRRLLPPMGGLDFSPMILLIGLSFLQRLLQSALLR